LITQYFILIIKSSPLIILYHQLQFIEVDIRSKNLNSTGNIN